MEHNPEDLRQLLAEGVYVSLTHCALDVLSSIAQVRSDKAGAIILFAGNFKDLEMTFRKTPEQSARNHARQFRREAGDSARVLGISTSCTEDDARDWAGGEG